MRAMRSTTGVSLGFLVLLISACGGGAGGEGGGGDGGGGGGPGPTQFFVDAAAGDDAADGSSGNPMRTIGRALGRAARGDTIQVAPGEYDEDHGETFPLVVPAGVTLLGDEASKGRGMPPPVGGPGAGQPPTLLLGFGPFAPGSKSLATVVAQQDAVVAGFWLYNDVIETPTAIPYAIIVQASQVPSLHPGATIRNNTIEGIPSVMPSGERVGIRILQSTSVHRIEGNTIRRYPAGILFHGGMAGGGARIEDNRVYENLIGIALSSGDGADLGGGPLGSAGRNELRCNFTFDLLVQSGVTTVPARANQWDHIAAGLTADISNTPAAAIDLTGATVSPQACP